MQSFSRYALAAFFTVAGVAHFLKPAPYLAIMPPFLPWPEMLVGISGAAEILGGLGVCFPVTRKVAGWALIALLIAVFPANLYAIITGMTIGGHELPAWLLWARLPFQAFFIAWVYQACLRQRQIPT